ncbi:hypothetical protein DLK05_02225 [Ancylomarina longa]|uniref:Uncharacterized protein n=1 Tax=Ancylomarina longa TaxID=2487017 RepID=A0A434AYI8_9BACT|nr:hypothetical protein DLK05_02225 [Ancylomarina longa]
MVFVCSGASDVGELTDVVARKLNQEGIATMDCGRKLMNKLGSSDFIHVRLCDLGYLKGATEPDHYKIDAIFEVVTVLL